MDDDLPLQIRKDIRDVWEKKDASVQRAVMGMREVLGMSIQCVADWPRLWAGLESVYSDKATFVPTVARVVEAWCHTLYERLEDDDLESWSYLFLDKLKSVPVGIVFLQISDEERATTWWSGTELAFVISLPSRTAVEPSCAASGFATDFETFFDTSRSREDDDVDDWADLESIPASFPSRGPDIRNRTEDGLLLPAVQTLPRPEVLFPSLTPCLLHVSTSNGASGPNKVIISGTHEPSLRLLAEYFQKWTKNDPQDVRKIPYLRIKLNDSKFGLGLFCDSLTIEPFDHHQRHVVVNVVVILGFIQGVLGYSPVQGAGGPGYWEFQRHSPVGP